MYRHGGHLGHVTWTIWTNFRSPIPRRLHMKFGFNRPSGFRGEDVWKCWHTTHTHTYTHTHIQTYGRQRPTYTISSPMSLKAQVSYQKRRKISKWCTNKTIWSCTPSTSTSLCWTVTIWLLLKGLTSGGNAEKMKIKRLKADRRFQVQSMIRNGK